MNSIWLIIPALLIATFFLGMGHALAASNKLKIELGSYQGRFSLQIQYLFLQHLVKFSMTMSLGYIFSITCLECLFIDSTIPVFSMLTNNILLRYFLQILVVTFLLVFFVEIIARTLFRINSNKALTYFSVPAYFCYILFSPINWFIQTIVQMLPDKKFKNGFNSIYEISSGDQWPMESELLPNKDDNGSQELKIFQNALVFSKVRVRDCMIPRTEIEAVDINTDIEELTSDFVKSGYSKLIVYNDNIDNIVGYINSKELFKHPSNIEEKLNSVSFVPETMPASVLLKKFMKDHRSIVVVVDEYGGTSGIVTLEDIIEEIFGEIEDEHDTIDEVAKKVRQDEYVFSCRLEIEYINSKFNLQIPESESYDTLAGFILYHYHNLPKPNEVIVIDNFNIKILKMSKNRIELALLKKTAG